QVNRVRIHQRYIGTIRTHRTAKIVRGIIQGDVLVTPVQRRRPRYQQLTTRVCDRTARPAVRRGVDIQRPA
ncbi:MAG: hypothetical protein GWN45_02305, partial [Gammaproteobacteria bacterium]|nr:hypothetical protein [Gammaproteobacteria bacterium]